MRDAWETLNVAERHAYWRILVEQAEMRDETEADAANATAQQRAEAFVILRKS